MNTKNSPHPAPSEQEGATKQLNRDNSRPDPELSRLHRIAQYVRSRNIVHHHSIEDVPLDEREKQEVGRLNGLFSELSACDRFEGLQQAVQRAKANSWRDPRLLKTVMIHEQSWDELVALAGPSAITTAQQSRIKEIEEAVAASLEFDKKADALLAEDRKAQQSRIAALEGALRDGVKMCASYNRDSSAWRQHLSDFEQSARALLPKEAS